MSTRLCASGVLCLQDEVQTLWPFLVTNPMSVFREDVFLLEMSTYMLRSHTQLSFEGVAMDVVCGRGFFVT